MNSVLFSFIRRRISLWGANLSFSFCFFPLNSLDGKILLGWCEWSRARLWSGSADRLAEER